MSKRYLGGGVSFEQEDVYQEFSEESGETSTLAGLTDVDISEPTNGETLVYNAASEKWENGSVASLTDTVKQALLQIASKVAYIDDDGLDYYNDLYDALYTGENWSITNTLTGCTSSNAAASVANNSSYSATITASSGYTLTGATVSVTMGGSDITATAYNNGVISIAAVTGALVITISAALDFPSEYQKVEYLQSTGSEYIDTGIYGDLTTAVEMSVQRISGITSTARLFGARTGTNQATYANGFFISTRVNSSNGYFYAQMDDDELRPTTNWSLDKIKLKLNSSGAYINDVLTFSDWRKISINTQPETPSEFTTPQTMGLFNAKQEDTWGTGMAARLWGITIKKNGVTVFNGIPCYRKADNEPGIYDIISDTFFANTSGSGAFSVGGDT